jgi:hypothetical protein
MLLTALIYNRAFYAMTENYRGFISAGLPVGKVEGEISETSDVEENAQMEYRMIRETPTLVVFYFILPVKERNTAANDSEKFKEIFHNSIAYNDIRGTLYFMGNKYKQVYLEFIFDKYKDKIPFGLELCFTTTQDHKEHTIVITADKDPMGDRETDITVVRSDVINGINYSGGIDANYKIGLKLLTNS